MTKDVRSGDGIKVPTVIGLEIHSDDRGYLVPLTNTLKGKLDKEIKRVYVVGNFGKGVIRGFHYHKREIKIFYIARGAAKFVAINPDDDKERYVFTASDRAPNLIIIPPGYANGWVSLENNTILISFSTSTFEESAADDVRYDPYKWGDVWTVKGR